MEIPHGKWLTFAFFSFVLSFFFGISLPVSGAGLHGIFMRQGAMVRDAKHPFYVARRTRGRRHIFCGFPLRTPPDKPRRCPTGSPPSINLPLFRISGSCANRCARSALVSS